jgi:hypothetical protein
MGILNTIESSLSTCVYPFEEKYESATVDGALVQQ